MNPALPEPAAPAKRMLSEKAERFTESVIREMTRLALRHAAVNLAQGFPDFPAPAEIKRAAQGAGRYFPSITSARQAFPQLEARKMDEVPGDIWRLVYPLPYALSVERFSARAKLDPMLVAGLIRQESVFQRDAISRAGAVGLMQVLPSTGRGLARKLRIGYSRARLTEPDYNLRLGTTYLVELIQRQGSLERALAAYNAGEDRVALWQAERQFEEPAEFVQSIPFTETREYVQIVLRNAELYRRLYGLPR